VSNNSDSIVALADPQERTSRGAILIVVLMVLVVMSLIVMQFSFTMSLNRMIAVNNSEITQLAYMALGGVEYAKNALRADRQLGETDSFLDSWANIELPYEPPFKTEVTVQDECGKMNVNALIAPNGALNTPVKEALERLFENMDINIEAVHRLADYLDPDTDGDFEDGARNAPLDDLTDLLNIEYITPDVFFGVPAQSEDDKPVLGLVSLLTIQGPGQVNINTAPEEVIMALFGKAREELAQFLEYREKNAIRDLQEVAQIGFSSATIGPMICYTSDYYRVISRAYNDRISRTAECLVVRGNRKITVIEQRNY